MIDYSIPTEAEQGPFQGFWSLSRDAGDVEEPFAVSRPYHNVLHERGARDYGFVPCSSDLLHEAG
jgi:hypothetical protein